MWRGRPVRPPATQHAVHRFLKTIETERLCCVPRYRLPAHHRYAPLATCAVEPAHPAPGLCPV